MTIISINDVLAIYLRSHGAVDSSVNIVYNSIPFTHILDSKYNTAKGGDLISQLDSPSTTTSVDPFFSKTQFY